MSTWPQVALGDLIHHRKHFVEIDDLKTYKRCRVQLHAKGIVLRDTVQGTSIKTKEQQVCKTGDFLIAEIDAKLGGYGIVPAELDGAIVSSHYFLFDVASDKLLREFLGWFIRTPYFHDQVQAQGSTNYAAIRPAHVLEYKIPLPPIMEQRRIVAKIEKLAAKIEEARELRQRAISKTETFADAVASRLFSEFSKHYPISDVSIVRGGIQKSPDRYPGANPVRYLTVAHVQRNHIDTGDPRYFEVSPKELERWRLLTGDVLIIEGNGSTSQIGRTALFRGEIDDCVHQNHVIRIRPDSSRLLPEFLNTFLNSPAGQDAVQAQSRTTSGLRTLSVGRIKAIEVPVPPLPLQHRIVSELDALQEKFDTLKRIQADTSKELDALLPSILDKAFKGEL